MATVPDQPYLDAVLAYLADTAPVLAFVLDAERRVRQPNQYARAMLGPELEGRAFASLLPELITPPDVDSLAETPEVVTMVTLATAVGAPESYRFRFHALADRALLALGSPDVDAASRLQSALLGLNQELSNRSRQLQRANAELTGLNRLKNQFLGMAAHDLRRPINVVMIYTEFVLAEAAAQLSAEHQAFLRTSLAAATDMRRLIDSFLDLAVMESGRLQLDLQPISASDIVAGMLPIAKLTTSRRQLTLTVDVADAARTVLGDIAKLQQVLSNLIDNAIQHSQPGQRIWLSAAWQTERLVFAVRDEGAGLAPALHGRVFEAFERIGTAKSAEERQAGLGLAIARMIVEAHQGRIWIDSQPGRGATISFSLPVAAS